MKKVLTKLFQKRWALFLQVLNQQLKEKIGQLKNFILWEQGEPLYLFEFFELKELSNLAILDK